MHALGKTSYFFLKTLFCGFVFYRTNNDKAKDLDIFFVKVERSKRYTQRLIVKHERKRPGYVLTNVTGKHPNKAMLRHTRIPGASEKSH